MDTVLLLEDNATLAASLKERLELASFKVTHVASLREARAILGKQSFSLHLFDVNLPDGTGFELCRELQATHSGTPVIFLTAKSDEESAVEGLSLGARDYVRKPFQIRELIARIRTQISRAGKAGKQSEYGGVVIDMAERRVSYQNKKMALTPREFAVFSYLVRHGGTLVNREKCLEEIDTDADLNSRSLDTLVSRIRKKLEKNGAEALTIESEYGIGYRLVRK